MQINECFGQNIEGQSKQSCSSKSNKLDARFGPYVTLHVLIGRLTLAISLLEIPRLACNLLAAHEFGIFGMSKLDSLCRLVQEHAPLLS